MTDSSASPFSLRDFCSGLYDVLDRADVYQDGDSLVECAVGGGPALTLVETALELRMNPRTRRGIADLKQAGRVVGLSNGYCALCLLHSSSSAACWCWQSR